MKTYLKEIVSGYHNDTNCKKYQEFYKNAYGKAPQSCRFKGHRERIPQLLDKIDFDENDSEVDTDHEDSRVEQFEQSNFLRNEKLEEDLSPKNMLDKLKSTIVSDDQAKPELLKALATLENHFSKEIEGTASQTSDKKESKGGFKNLFRRK